MNRLQAWLIINTSPWVWRFRYQWWKRRILRGGCPHPEEFRYGHEDGERWKCLCGVVKAR